MATKKDAVNFYEALDEKFSHYWVKPPTDITKIKAISTGSISLDVAIGVGGIPMRKFTEIYGAESSGKTTLALSVVKHALLMGYNVLYVDAEQAIDYGFALGVTGDVILDQSRFTLLKPEIMEDALKICEDGIKSRNFGLIILDSIASMAPRKVKADGLDDSNPYILSKKLTTFLQRNAYDINFYDVAFIGVNQVRDDTSNPYLRTYSTPGGHAWKHLLSLRIQLSKVADILVGEEKIGISTRFTIKKSKVAPPFRSSNFPIIFGQGIDSVRDALAFAETLGVLQKAHAYYKYKGEVIGKGTEATLENLNNNKELLDEIINACYTVGNKEHKIEEIEENEEDDS